MFRLNRTRNLKEGELLLREVRRTPWSLIGSALLTLAVLLGPFFFLFPLLRLGSWGVGLFFLALFTGLVLLVRLLILYFFNVLIITNLRLIDVDQRGFFTQVVSETTYDKIQDVSYAIKGLGQTLLQYGNVMIQTAGNQANLEIRSVRYPERVHELVMKVQAEYRAASAAEGDELTAEELLRLVDRLKRGLGDAGFRELIGRTKKGSTGKEKPPTP